MPAEITCRSESSFKIEIEISYSKDMLSGEESLQRSLNEAGCMATAEILEQFDSDGSQIAVGGVTFYPRSEKESKCFQTPYGQCDIERYIYQSASGGPTYVPLEISARIIGTSTPKMAKMVSSKYANDGAPGVQRDLAENHNRPLALSFIKKVSDAVGIIAITKEESWTYELPTFEKSVGSISVGLDGTCLNMKEDGWREAMCGTIAFFDRSGNRMHTVYTAAEPEYGKEKFLTKLDREIDNVIRLFPDTPIIGLADGASSNWTFLKGFADVLTVDFWHFSEYLSKAASAMYPGKNNASMREQWLEDACNSSKHKHGAVSRLLKEMETFIASKRMRTEDRSTLQSTITYLNNHKTKMHYAKNIEANIPIGSGVTEAACKSLVKVRMCRGGARWNSKGASVVLTLRAIHMTSVRWDSFWSKYSRYGYKAAA